MVRESHFFSITHGVCPDLRSHGEVHLLAQPVLQPSLCQSNLPLAGGFCNERSHVVSHGSKTEAFGLAEDTRGCVRISPDLPLQKSVHRRVACVTYGQKSWRPKTRSVKTNVTSLGPPRSSVTFSGPWTQSLPDEEPVGVLPCREAFRTQRIEHLLGAMKGEEHIARTSTKGAGRSGHDLSLPLQKEAVALELGFRPR